VMENFHQVKLDVKKIIVREVQKLKKDKDPASLNQITTQSIFANY
jgi:hypothetical protein